MCIANTTTTTTASGNHSTSTNKKENINSTNTMYQQPQQQYSVQLVHAETKQPFRETHGPDGKVHSSMNVACLHWIEVEVAGTANNKHRFRFSPNGKILGYQNTLTPRNRSRSNSTSSNSSNSSSNSSSTTSSRPVRSDLWAYRYADRTDSGLMCFRRSELDDQNSTTSTSTTSKKTTDTPENVLMGDISLQFLETMHQGSFSPGNTFKSFSLAPGAAPVAVSSPLMIPTIAIQQRRQGSSSLETITVHYWPAHQLIQVAVLSSSAAQQQTAAAAATELWNQERVGVASPWKRPCSPDSSPDCTSCHCFHPSTEAAMHRPAKRVRV